VSEREAYIGLDLARLYRRQALRVWFGGALVALAWVLLILLPPAAMAGGLENLANGAYKGFAFICHQMPDRSFHLFGHKFGVCSRCFGVYFGLLAGFAIYPMIRRVEIIEPFPRFWLFGSMIPIGIDWALTIFGYWENTFTTRFLTGLILGVACAVYIVPALVEIFRLTTRPETQKRPSL
jgi:uncharacterized membrane protein